MKWPSFNIDSINADWQIYNWDEKQSAREKAEKEEVLTNKNKNIDIEGKRDSHETVTRPSRDNAPTPTQKPSKAFVVPAMRGIQAYITEKGYTFSAEKVHVHYESNGWMVGKNKMKCWKSTCTGWQVREKTRPATGSATDAGVIAA